MTKRIQLTVTPKSREDFHRIKANLIKRGFRNASVTDKFSFFYKGDNMVSVVKIKTTKEVLELV